MIFYNIKLSLNISQEIISFDVFSFNSFVCFLYHTVYLANPLMVDIQITYNFSLLQIFFSLLQGIFLHVVHSEVNTQKWNNYDPDFSKNLPLSLSLLNLTENQKHLFFDLQALLSWKERFCSLLKLYSTNLCN